MKKVKYYLNKNGEFVIENYQSAKAFSSFFPGIAGVWGIPIWAFYVNRGQCMTSFGIKDKDHPIMEFKPANKSYYLTPIIGFRTFIKTKHKNKDVIYDAFSNSPSSLKFDIDSKMIISSSELKLKEINHTLGIEVDIEYFTIPNDNYGSLARKVSVKNISKSKKSFQLLDGMPRMQPYGVNNMFLKQMGRTVEAWMMVENLKNSIPYFRLKVEPADRPEVVHVKEGNFYASFDSKGLIKPIVDSGIVFGTSGDFTYPAAFAENKNFKYPLKQQTRSKTPSAFAYTSFNLTPSKTYTLYTLIGNMNSLDKLKSNTRRITNEDYFNKKQSENKAVISDLQRPVFTSSSSKEFDQYSAQNFLDNIMRGGYPVSIKHASGKTDINLYSRKHGDPERDYNMFLVEPTYFSQGNGNYRDVNQNRRCDVWFNPGIKEDSIISFFSLLQTDGYNPLVIKPDRFHFNQDYNALNNFFNRYNLRKIKEFLKTDFTPGELFFFMEQERIMFSGRKRDLIATILENSLKHHQADHGEGFWIDHWHYCLDLLENYLGLYPEELENILFNNREFSYYDNSHTVRPRSHKYVLENNRVWQFNSVIEDKQKQAMIERRTVSPHLSRIEHGHGKIYKAALITKMLCVIGNKFATLDPSGVGIEMESDKPNWYDSLNGLPGLMGSSTCETFELKRWIQFLIDNIKSLKLNKKHSINMPSEVYTLLSGLGKLCKENLDNHSFWDKRHNLKERYRTKTLMGFSGLHKSISVTEIVSILERFLKTIDKGLSRALNKDSRLYYSYFINRPVDYSVTVKSEHRTHAKVKKFKQIPLPLFLEGIVHAFRVTDNQKTSLKYYNAVKKSPLYDKALKMYKVCAPLEKMPEEIGRNRIFTPGWLENESIWLHMEYKYMLELIKNGLYEEFYQDFKDVFVPFHDPAKYGRSILENSSFIVSSAFPKKELHGNGFVARLSGSTAEFINIWLIMCAGKKPFSLDKDDRLIVDLKPILPGWLFTKKDSDKFKKGTFAFRFLNNTLVVYHNKKLKNTFGKNAAKVKEIIIKPKKGKSIILKSSHIPAPYSYELRHGKISQIDIILN